VLTLRRALASSGRSSQSAGNVPNPGIGAAPGAWNIPRMSDVALIGTGTAPPRVSVRIRPAAEFDGAVESRTKKPRCLRASTKPHASNCS
jgi:hypothetical protein